MEIVRKMKVYKNFEDIKEGTVFIADSTNPDYVFMKTFSTYCDDSGDFDNAVSLNDGTLTYFSDNAQVLPLDCKLIIE